MKAIIIDDEKHVREGLLMLAEWEKHGISSIFEAEDGEEAIRLIGEVQPDIIFTDMNMPRCDGISLLKWIHGSKCRGKTIVVSGYDDYEYMRNAIYYKSFDYILKPIDPELLNETLGRAVNDLASSSVAWDGLREQKEMKAPQKENNIKQIEEFLVQNYHLDITLQDIADRFYLSREYISRRFKQDFQATITDYLTNIRMEKAKELLGSPSLKIYEIAYQVGYQNEKYFSKVFKKLTGYTPNEYRNLPPGSR